MANPFDLRTILLAKHPQHVVLIRFPIALFITGVGLDLLSPGNRASQLAAAAYLNISIAAAAMIPAALAGMLGLAIRTRWKEAKRHSVVPRRCSFDCRGVAPDVVVGTLAVTQIGIASAPETSHPSRIVRRGSHR